MAGATLLHADLDAFYASVEQLLDPTLRGRPIAVGGGVVLAASYEARVLGVRAGMPGWRARKLCPDLRFVGGHFRKYQELGDAVVEVFRDFTPVVERISIDEAYLDVAGAVRLFGPPPAIAAAIRQRVHDEIGLAVSVGVARTRQLAKIASQVAKPDGLVVVPPDREIDFLGPLPVGLVWGIGAATEQRLANTGVRTIGELCETSTGILQTLLGEAAGAKLGAIGTERDRRDVVTTHTARSVGAQSALGRRRATHRLVREAIGYLADRVATRLRASGRAGRTVTVRVRFAQLRSVTRSVTLPVPISATLTLTEIGVDLVRTGLTDNPGEKEISLLGISVSNLVAEPALQLEMPLGLGDDRHRAGTASGAARWAADRSVDAVRERFGRDAVGYAALVFSEVAHVPEEFRELAERQS